MGSATAAGGGTTDEPSPEHRLGRGSDRCDHGVGPVCLAAVQAPPPRRWMHSGCVVGGVFIDISGTTEGEMNLRQTPPVDNYHVERGRLPPCAGVFAGCTRDRQPSSTSDRYAVGIKESGWRVHIRPLLLRTCCMGGEEQVTRTLGRRWWRSRPPKYIDWSAHLTALPQPSAPMPSIAVSCLDSRSR